MNLAKLKEVVDRNIRQLSAGENPENIPVVISLSEPSIAVRASSGIERIIMGFDWEKGQLRIEPSQSLIRKGTATTDILKVKSMEFDGKAITICRKCSGQVNAVDNFCKHCSQRLQ